VRCGAGSSRFHPKGFVSMPSYIHHTELPYGAGEICTCQSDHWRRQIHARCGACSKWIYPGIHPHAGVHSRALDWLAESRHVVMCGTTAIGGLPRYGMRLPSRDTNPLRVAGYRRSRWDRGLRVGIELELLAGQDGDNSGLVQMRTLDAFLAFNRDFGRNARVGMYGVLKHEASVRQGFELCTVPCTVQEHTQHLHCMRDMLWLDSHQDCGLHIHMDRRDLTPILLGKLFQFWNRVADLATTHQVMGRGSNHWAVRTDTRRSSGMPYQNPRRAGRRNHHLFGGKMRVLRVDRPSTIELRLPAASINPAIVVGRISAFVTSTLFLRDVSIADVSAGRITLESMYAWCMEHDRQQDPDIAPFVSAWDLLVPNTTWR
jgi:hypothetical protein